MVHCVCSVQVQCSGYTDKCSLFSAQCSWHSTQCRSQQPVLPTSGQELHDEVEVDGVLEWVVHLHDPHVVRLHQHVPLRSHVGDLQHDATTHTVTTATNAQSPPLTDTRHSWRSRQCRTGNDRFDINNRQRHRQSHERKQVTGNNCFVPTSALRPCCCNRVNDWILSKTVSGFNHGSTDSPLYNHNNNMM